MQNRMKHFQLTKEEIDALLERADIGRFGTVREDGYPYAIPMHFVYYNGTIYMHGLPKGLKIDNVKGNPRACFEVDELLGLQPGEAAACDTEAIYNSVVVLGRAHILEDIPSKREVLNRLVEKYTPQFAGKELPENMVKGTAVIELQVKECTGKYHK
ncbi:pyridoxamine 5'-phosphate oxidase family protein [Desulfosporosinus youngiae]|uniref:Putative flavin-nucleotide-binding protein n=1 Tax=Desulfosporosinus youngiae DSM 17734 TaxID=768710 RepID=H5Y3K0_9FIRM|nr:pyridoxamine 5'-phosphate oxidase family protein [Desulfosporosinus youngiae]EHQ89109.1 putative flavin-nucleotide-binding protein [Desulfosporosinus youngiae DSM 17734]